MVTWVGHVTRIGNDCNAEFQKEKVKEGGPNGRIEYRKTVDGEYELN
jgi:hypothetical protein